jgi:hypothetical protein
MVACDGIASLWASVVVPEVQRLVMASQATVTIASASFAALRGGCACSHAFAIRVGRMLVADSVLPRSRAPAAAGAGRGGFEPHPVLRGYTRAALCELAMRESSTALRDSKVDSACCSHAYLLSSIKEREQGAWRHRRRRCFATWTFPKGAMLFRHFPHAPERRSIARGERSAWRSSACSPASTGRPQATHSRVCKIPSW